VNRMSFSMLGTMLGFSEVPLKPFARVDSAVRDGTVLGVFEANSRGRVYSHASVDFGVKTDVN
jgi:hypothetical protein